MFKFFYRPPEFFPEGQIFTKNYHFLAIWGPYGNIFKAIAVKFGMSVWSWGSLHKRKYCKNRLRRNTPFRQIYTKKIPILAILGAVGPYFLSHNDEIWQEEAELGLPPQAKFGKNRLRGYTPFWQNYTKN